VTGVTDDGKTLGSGFVVSSDGKIATNLPAQEHLEWTPSRLVNQAQSIGPHTARLFARILADKPHPEMGCSGCLGLMRLAKEYSPARMEAAAERALLTGACRYQSVKSILKN